MTIARAAIRKLLHAAASAFAARNDRASVSARAWRVVNPFLGGSSSRGGTLRA
ncbi:MAG: hypothetical protein ACYDDU_11870 [Dermatophilaceae bacterium]